MAALQQLPLRHQEAQGLITEQAPLPVRQALTALPSAMPTAAPLRLPLPLPSLLPSLLLPLQLPSLAMAALQQLPLRHQEAQGLITEQDCLPVRQALTALPSVTPTAAPLRLPLPLPSLLPSLLLPLQLPSLAMAALQQLPLRHQEAQGLITAQDCLPIRQALTALP